MGWNLYVEILQISVINFDRSRIRKCRNDMRETFELYGQHSAKWKQEFENNFQEVKIRSENTLYNN